MSTSLREGSGSQIGSYPIPGWVRIPLPLPNTKQQHSSTGGLIMKTLPLRIEGMIAETRSAIDRL